MFKRAVRVKIVELVAKAENIQKSEDSAMEEMPPWMEHDSPPQRVAKPVYYIVDDSMQISDFLSDIARLENVECDVKNIASLLKANGIGEHAGDLRNVGVDFLPFLGVPEELAQSIGSALKGQLVERTIFVEEVKAQVDLRPSLIRNRSLADAIAGLSKTPPSSSVVTGVQRLLEHDEKKIPARDIDTDTLREYMDRSEKALGLWNLAAEIAGDAKDDNAIDDVEPVDDSLPFDCCRICRNPNADGPKEFFEPCFHIMCTSCLHDALMERVNEKAVIGLTCPVRGCSSDFAVPLIKHLLNDEEFNLYLEATLMDFVGHDENTMECPNEECKSLLSLDIPDHVEIPPNGIAEKDSKGKVLSQEAFIHFSKYRVRCRDCSTAFCANCRGNPYHKGFTCDGYQEYLKARQCRFCHAKLTPQNTSPTPADREYSDALVDVCTQEDCTNRQTFCCDKTLECGCYCNGIRDEEECLPCLKCDLDIAGDYCAICYVEALEDAPCIRLEGDCTHVYHYECVRNKIAAGYSGARINFAFRNCPMDQKPLRHWSLSEVLEPVNALEARILELAMMRLHKDGRQNDDKVLDPSSSYYNDPEAYAMHIYLFFMCYECKKPYFAGGYQCQEASAGFDPAELVCPACQPEAKNIEECKVHGKDWIAFKCRYCSYDLKFCDNCHKPGTWQTLSTFRTGANKKSIWEYPQCEGLVPKIEKIRRKNLSEDKMMAKLEMLLCDPKRCPLGIAHPPNGFEFGMGCTMCADKDEEEENKRAAEKAAKEEEEKKDFEQSILEIGKKQSFEYDHDLDENGFLFFLGTKARTRAYQNPAASWYLSISSSAFQGSSDKPSKLGLRTVPASFLSVPDEEAFIQFSFDTMLSLNPTHYTLVHHGELDDHYLRNWTIDGSGDGRSWVTIKTHRNDRKLSQSGGSYTWKLSTKKKFRHFRIALTGPSSSNQYIIALGGFEIYGNGRFHI